MGIFDRKTSQDGWRYNKRVDEAFREEPSTYENCICSKGVVSTNTRVIRGSWKSVGQQSRMTTNQNCFEAAHSGLEVVRIALVQSTSRVRYSISAGHAMGWT